MSNLPKILIVHNYYKIPGGEDSVVANEKRLLEANGHQVFFYSRNNLEIDKFNFFKKLILPFTSIFSFKTYREVKRLIKKEKIDIVHVHNTLSLISPAVYYAAKKCKVPVVQTIHNFRMLCPSATFYRDDHICEDCVTHGLKCAIKNKCYRNSRMQTFISVMILKIHRLFGIYKKINYICLTEFNKKKLLQQKQIKPEQIFVKPNFVESDRKVLPYEQRKNQFIFVGRLDKLKGIDFLLEAWNEMGEDAPTLFVCGIGPMEEWCKLYVDENHLTSVILLGHVKNDEAISLIGESKALVMPTRWYEGFPMTIAESFAVGTPVIGTDIGNVGDLIIEGQTGWKINLKENFISAVIKCKNTSYIKLDIKSQVLNENYNVLNEIYDRIMIK